MVLSAPILPSLSIDPVFSSASATRRRLLPHFTVTLLPMLRLLKPITRMKVVSIDPEAVMVSCEPPEGSNNDGAGETPFDRRSVSASLARSGKPAFSVNVIIGELPDSSRSRLRGDPRSSC